MFDQQNYPAAVTSLNDDLRRDAGHLPSLRARGLAYFHLANGKQGLPDLTAVVDAKRADADVLLARGMIYAASKNHQAAVADFTATLRVRPGFARAFWERSKSYVALGDRVRAQADYNQALSSMRRWGSEGDTIVRSHRRGPSFLTKTTARRNRCLLMLFVTWPALMVMQAKLDNEALVVIEARLTKQRMAAGTPKQVCTTCGSLLQP